VVASASVATSRKTDAIGAPKVAPTAEQLRAMVDEISAKVAQISPQLQFSIDKESGKTIIKVTDRNTNEVVWQFPTDEALQITRELDRFQKGLLLNRQA
jgi:flagellar protein FlaG